MPKGISIVWYRITNETANNNPANNISVLLTAYFYLDIVLYIFRN